MSEKKNMNNSTANHPRVPPRISSEILLAGAQALHIEHAGELYILRRTSNGKLILTK
jgi:hemin uptake protein HemP